MLSRLLHNSLFDSCDYLATALVGQPPLKKMIAYTTAMRVL
ncbi:MAG: hypothetical protein ACLFVQ_11125 [Chitinispirillaceae bacterium]